MAFHERRCAACSLPYDDYDNARVIDHCHLTGLVRGLLHQGCNLQEPGGTSERWVQYRRRPPAVILEWTEPYHHPLHGAARPKRWVVDQLGPVPSNPRAAAAYLAAAASVTELLSEQDAALSALLVSRLPSLTRAAQPAAGDEGA